MSFWGHIMIEVSLVIAMSELPNISCLNSIFDFCLNDIFNHTIKFSTVTIWLHLAVIFAKRVSKLIEIMFINFVWPFDEEVMQWQTWSNMNIVVGFVFIYLFFSLVG